MLTPNNIRNPKRRSGYDHVAFSSSDTHPAAKPYQALIYSGISAARVGRMGIRWRGPRRATALEAAQDYCNYLNGVGVSAPAILASPGHKGRRTKRSIPSDIEAARGMVRDFEAQERGDVQGYVYLIIEDNPGGGIGYGKIGYSTNPEARVVELQTGNPRPLKLLYAMPGTEADERGLHADYIQNNVLQEWFRVTPKLILEFPVECSGNQAIKSEEAQTA